MTDKAKKYLIGLLCTAVAMFLWIFVAVALTGGRDVGDFTDRDQIIMTVFAVVEIVTVIAMLLYAVLLGKEQGKQVRYQMHTEEKNWDKNTKRRGTALVVMSVAIAFGAMLGGIVLGKEQTQKLQDLSGLVLVVSFAVSATVLLLNMVLKKWYVGRFENRKVSQVYQFIYSHREHAEQTAARKLPLLKIWRCLTGVYAILLGVLGLCAAVCGGILYSNSNAVPLCFFASLLILCAFSRIRFPVSRKVFDENNAYISEEAYPQLYAIARKAAQTIGCGDRIKIALLPNCNAGIAKIGQTFSVQMGVILLSTLSEEEVYSVLLHEFAHVAGHNSKAMKEGSYNAWIRNGRTPHHGSVITNLFFAFFDVFYTLQFSLYEYASSIQVEAAADQAMLLSGKPAAVASALLKLKYYDLFEWEKGTQDMPSMYEPELPDKQFLKKETERFRQAMSQKQEKWKQLLDVEIQSRSASHPTAKLRLEALGIYEFGLIDTKTDSDFVKECEKAQEYVDGLIYDDLKEVYDANRKTFYLEPKEQVEAWEKAGRPVVAQEYGDVVWALRQLGRNSDAIALCESAIEELSDAASSSGYFIRGCYRLHSYDEAGISDIYLAIENNSNYLQEGIDAIGTFCCLTGNQKELDIYREKALELAQKHKDQYSQLGVLTKKDHLSEESLPTGMLEEILDYIRSIDDGQIEKIYLVRKTITEDFFTSVFVIRFDLKAEDEACSTIMHKIFQYLDTCSDWQFSLFDYQDVMSVPVYEVKNSCVYSKEER